MSEEVSTGGSGSESSLKQTEKAVKPRANKPIHPPTSDMIFAAVKNLKERNGPSYQAIKKYIAATYMIDVDRQKTYIKKSLKKAVESGILIQTKGKGASGSFKLSKTAESKPKEAKKSTTDKKSETKRKPKAENKKKVEKSEKPKKTTSKKEDAKKKTAKKEDTKKKTEKKKVVDKKEKPVKKVVEKSSAVKKMIVKKNAKSPVSKPKAPKPKKVAVKK